MCERNTSLGKIRGIEKDGIMNWFGIPYAKPPIGELRFKRAVLHEGWDGVRDCKMMGPKPWQMAGGMFEKLTYTDYPQSEDCLHINVWAKKDAKKQPVMVWIYGGGHHAGEASAPEYNLKHFAEEGIVGVSFNYRLGVLGFQDFSAYSDAFDSNCAISDMVMALEWVHKNIENFGGDPGRVTLCGQSAGGSAILALLAVKEVKTYFNQAIIMSGVLSNTTKDMSKRINNEKYLKWVGVKPEEIDRLKNMTYEELKAGSSKFFSEPDYETPGIMAPGPMVDDLVTEFPLDAIKSGKVADKKLLFGTCQEEGGLFNFMKICPRSFQEIEKMLTLNGYQDKIPAFYQVYGQLDENKAVKTINTDRMFWVDTMKCAKAQSKYQDTFMYRFNFETPLSRAIRLGPTHSMDVCPALGTRKGITAKFYKGTLLHRRLRLQMEMHEAFVAFIKTGNPSTDRLGTWPPFEEKEQNTMVFSRHTALEMGAQREEVVRLWEDIELYL